MNPPAETIPTETDTRPGEVRTYRGRTVEELIPRIRAELGPGAMILRERQGLTGGVGGFFAKRCVEIDAQSAPRLSVYADDEEATMFEAEAGKPTPDPFAGFAARLEQAATFVPTLPPAQVAADTGPATGFIAFDELAAEREPGPEPDTSETQPESGTQPESESQPEPLPTAVFSTKKTIEPEPVALTVPILLDVAPAASDADSVFRPRPLQADGAQWRSAFRPLAAPVVGMADEVVAAPSGQTRVRERLTGHGLTGALADQLVAAAHKAAGSEEESMLTVAAQAALAAMLPQATPLPLEGGVIAVVGAAGSGKTRAVAALAASCARAGHSVTVARLGGADRDEELTELLEGEEDVELIPAMKTKSTVRAVAAAREEDLVILDTPSTTPGEDSTREALTATLARFSPDGVLLCAPATFTLRALRHLVEHHAGLQVDGLLATHADQAGMLGTVAELSIESRIPLGHVHAGLDLTHAISSVDPGALAADLVR